MTEPVDLRKQNTDGITGFQKPAEKRGWWERMTGEKMKTSEKIIGVILLILFLLIFYISLDANKYSAQVLVIEGEGRIGVNPTTERLDFGDLSRGASSIRRVDIENQTPIPMWIAVVRLGSIAGLMDLNKNYFTLAPRTADTIEFTVYMPASGEVGEKYTGRVFIFRIPSLWN